MPNSKKRLIIRNGTLIDGTGAPPVPNDAVVISGGRIESVGPMPEDILLEDPDNLQIIDASGKTVMPGLIDAHCHLSYGEPQSPEVNNRYTPAEYSALCAAWNAQKVLRAGVTSICVPGGSWFTDVAVRDSINAGMFEGPRIFCAGRLLSPYGAITDHEPVWGETPDSSTGVPVNTVHEMVAEVRRQCKAGVDLIKVADSQSGDFQAISAEELKAITDEAHRRNKKVTTHSRGQGAIKASIYAGVDWVLHAEYATEEDFYSLAQAGIGFMPTLTLQFNFIDYAQDFGFSMRSRDAVRRLMERSARNLELARQFGVKVMCGTDSGFTLTPYGEWHAYEPELLVRHGGFTPMEAIVATTSNNAFAVGLEGQVGVIGPDKLADVLVLDGDPLQDISVLQDHSKISMVIKDGQPIDRDRPWPQRHLQSLERGGRENPKVIHNPLVSVS